MPLPVGDYTTSRVLTIDYIRGEKITKLSPLVRTEIDGEVLAEQLFRAYLQQILVDGFVHADPHPGNVFLTDDDQHRTPRPRHGGAHPARHAGEAAAPAPGRERGASGGGGHGGHHASAHAQPHFDERGFRRDVADLVAQGSRRAPSARCRWAGWS